MDTDGVPVRWPHVHAHDFNLIPIGHVVEIIHDSSLVAVLQQIQDTGILDVGQYTAVVA